MTIFVSLGTWYAVRDGDDRARALYHRHYSYLSRMAAKFPNGRFGSHHNLRKFVGPGESMILLTVNVDALFIWNYWPVRRDDQTGIECKVFRNESDVLSSTLIREAVELARQRWPHDRLFTFVDPREIRSSNPGYCFIKAGWRRLERRSKRGLVILECLE